MPTPPDDGHRVAVKASSTPGLNAGMGNPFEINEYINPPPDERLNSILMKMKSPLKQGILQQHDDWVNNQAGQKWPYAVRFMFNPPTISVGYSVASDVLPPGQQTTNQLAALSIYPGNTTISFGLLFDRTYDVAFGSRFSRGNKDARLLGVYRDIKALELLTGARFNITQEQGKITSPGSNGQDATTVVPAGPILGNMQMVPIFAIFGGGNGGDAGKPNAGLGFVGYITSMQVTYTLFSQNMVPTRAAVDITMQQLIGSNAADYNNKGGLLTDQGAYRTRTTTATLPFK